MSTVSCFALAGFFAWIVRETLIPSARLLAELVSAGEEPMVVSAALVILGIVFAATGRAPTAPENSYPFPRGDAATTWLVPALLALAYGAWHSDPPLWQRTGIGDSVLWYVVAVPVAEELVFRVGLYGALMRLGGGGSLTATNPLPVAVWASAVAFAAWHWDAGAWAVGRTFLLGLWLGWLRWRSGLEAPVVGHVAVNGAAILL